MPKATSKNSELLRDAKQITSPKIYSLLLDLVNDDREDLAELVLKVDYLISYSNKAIKVKDYKDAGDSIQKAEERIKMLKRQEVDVEHLQYLIEVEKNKIK